VWSFYLPRCGPEAADRRWAGGPSGGMAGRPPCPSHAAGGRIERQIGVGGWAKGVRRWWTQRRETRRWWWTWRCATHHRGPLPGKTGVLCWECRSKNSPIFTRQASFPGSGPGGLPSIHRLQPVEGLCPSTQLCSACVSTPSQSGGWRCGDWVTPVREDWREEGCVEFLSPKVRARGGGQAPEGRNRQILPRRLSPAPAVCARSPARLEAGRWAVDAILSLFYF
jgi:hypothetical protein